MNRTCWILVIISLWGISACDSQEQKKENNQEHEKELMTDTLITNSNVQEVISGYPKMETIDEKLQPEDVALYTVQNLFAGNDEAIDLISDENGVFFAPVVSCSLDEMFLMNDSFSKQMQSDDVIDWGTFAASGEPTRLTFADYVKQFVLNPVFEHADRVVNIFEQRGNAINKIKEKFPEEDVVEFHYPGTAQYDQLDWKSLNLVFTKVGGRYYLRAVINDQWSI